MAVIEARELSMRFGSIRALRDVSFDVREGEILGLLGPNGAGKTTAMRILTTYLVPTTGTATVAGFDILRQPLEVRRSLGYLPESVPVYPDMEVQEYLVFVGRGRNVGKSTLKSQLEYVVNACELAPVLRRPILELSKGYRQRVGLAQSMIHNPKVLILDEPTSGLDPMQILGIRKLLRELVSQGKTIIFSTHILQEVSAVSDRVVVISEGRTVADGTVDELRGKVKGRRTVVLIGSLSAEILAELRRMQAVVSCENGTIRAEFPAWEKSHVEIIKSRGWPVREVIEQSPTLEDAFVQLIRESKS